MKKLVIIAALLLISIPSWAQIKAGPRVSIMSTDLVTTTKSYAVFGNGIGYEFGGFLQLKLSKRLVLQPEVMWNRSGASMAFDNKVKLNYLSMPILVGFQPIENLSILAGPEFSRLISINTDNEKYAIVDIHAVKKDNYDWGISAGVDYQTDFRLGVGFRYYYGISKEFDVPVVNVDGFQEISSFRNRAFQIYVSYSLIK